MGAKENMVIERMILGRLVGHMLAQGHKLTVNDGEDETLKRSTDRAAVLKALRTTDEDYLIVHREGLKDGWVRLIYGNGIDLISDYTVNLEEDIAPVNEWVNKMEDQTDPENIYGLASMKQSIEEDRK
jgi:hypothetical protein